MRVPAPEAGAADYASAFRASTDVARARSPREWTRVVFEGAPAPQAVFVRFGWRHVLRLRLSDSPASVAGWRLTDCDEDSAVLEAHSPLLEARNVAFIDDHGLTWATYVRFHGRLGRAVWTIAARVHHIVLPHLLLRAVRRTERSLRSGGVNAMSVPSATVRT